MPKRAYQIKSGKHHRKEGRETKIYKPGDWIRMTEAEAGRIKDKLVLSTTPAPLIAEEKPAEDKSGLKLVQVGSGKYNVVNEATRKPVNEKPLSKAEAEALIGE